MYTTTLQTWCAGGPVYLPGGQRLGGRTSYQTGEQTANIDGAVKILDNCLCFFFFNEYGRVNNDNIYLIFHNFFIYFDKILQ